MAEGTFLESTPVRVDVGALDQQWSAVPVLVLPGFYGIDWTVALRFSDAAARICPRSS
jgi:hypothetical protein